MLEDALKITEVPPRDQNLEFLILPDQQWADSFDIEEFADLAQQMLKLDPRLGKIRKSFVPDRQPHVMQTRRPGLLDGLLLPLRAAHV